MFVDANVCLFTAAVSRAFRFNHEEDIPLSIKVHD